MRMIKGLAALLVLLAAVVGVPWLLIILAGNPLPPTVSLDGLWRVLSTPDDGSVLVRLVAIVAWVGWLVFAVSTVGELVTLLSRQRIRIRLPGLGGMQKAAGGLILLVLAMFVAPHQLASAEPVGSPSPAATAPVVAGEPERRQHRPESPPATAIENRQADADDDAVLHTVRPGDDLWSLAEAYYGNGQEWRRISTANPGVLTGGPDRLEPGWRLRIPGTERADRQVEVRAGDTLSAIAERSYGDPAQWTRIHDANRSVITDPDVLPVGIRLRVPAVPVSADQDAGGPGMDAGGSAASEDSKDRPADTEASGPARQQDPSTPTGPGAPTVPDPSTAPPATPGQSDQAERPDNHPDGPAEPPAGVPSAGVPSAGVPSAGVPSAGVPSAGAPATAVPSSPIPSSPAPSAGASAVESSPGATPSAQASAGIGATADASSATPVVDGSALGGPTGQDVAPGDHALQAAGIGGVLAAGLIAGIGIRRGLQLRARPLGRRIPHPPAAAQQLETALGRQQRPLDLEQLDLVLRAIGQHCRRQDLRLPVLQAVVLAGGSVELIMSEPDLPAPLGFTVDGRHWRLAGRDADYLTDGSGLKDAPQPYPVLASWGTDDAGATVLVNLEAAGIFRVGPGPRDVGDRSTGAEATAVITAAATELAFLPWADESVITVVGQDRGLVDAIDRYNVHQQDDLDQLLDRWEQRAALQRQHLGDQEPPLTAGEQRIDPDLADPWVPEVALVLTAPDDHQSARLHRLLSTEPAVTMAAVVPDPGWAAESDHDHDADTRAAQGRSWGLRLIGPQEAELVPLGIELTPQLITDAIAEPLHQLVACTGSERTDPAPWWAEDFPPGTPGPARAVDLGEGDAHRPGHAVAYRVDQFASHDRDHAAPPPADREPAEVDHLPSDEVDHESSEVDHQVDHESPSPAGWPSAAVRALHPVSALVAPDDDPSGAPAVDLRPIGPSNRFGASEESATVPSPFAGMAPPTPRHPTILLLGPIDLIGAAGKRPSRAVIQCIEYCTWLLEHPGSTAQAMAAALVVAEGTRRSNMSRLRTWLGTDDRGEPYLPDAYSGRIMLSALVSSDWHRLQLLTATGVNRSSSEGLIRALELVRGAPLADAAPGQWHWAEEMRTDMVSVIRDIGVELADRALADSDLDLARWAAARSLTAAPQDEMLLGMRIRTEHQAGNAAEVERLALQLSSHARALGVDLHPDTVDLLQRVMEGGLRARA